MPTPRMLALLAVAAAVAAGCGRERGSGTQAPGPECEAPCGIGLVVTVVDAGTGASLTDASVSVAGPTCTVGTCSCQLDLPDRQFVCPVPNGTYTVTAQASGYVAGTAAATFEGGNASGCCQPSTQVTIALSR